MTKNVGINNGNWRGAEMRDYMRSVSEVKTPRNDERKAAAKAAMTCNCGWRKEAWMPECRHCADARKQPSDLGCRVTISGGEVAELDQPATTAADEYPF